VNRLLLDTEAFIWWDADDARLGRSTRALIQSAAEVYVSAASASEIVIKASLGKLKTSRRPAEAVVDASFSELPVTFQHADEVRRLPPHHRDPFDRLIVAAARVEALTLVTSDQQLTQYDVPYVDARR
jgi:PIN domain nuclease of toxin-antitoxin system